MHHRDQEILHSMLQVHDVAIGLHLHQSRFTDNWKRSEIQSGEKRREYGGLLQEVCLELAWDKRKARPKVA